MKNPAAPAVKREAEEDWANRNESPAARAAVSRGLNLIAPMRSGVRSLGLPLSGGIARSSSPHRSSARALMRSPQTKKPAARLSLANHATGRSSARPIGRALREYQPSRRRRTLSGRRPAVRQVRRCFMRRHVGWTRQRPIIACLAAAQRRTQQVKCAAPTRGAQSK